MSHGLTPPSWSEIGESGPCPALERQREAGTHKAEPALQLTEATEQNKTTVAHCSSKTVEFDSIHMMET